MSVSRALALAVAGLMCMFHATLVFGGSVTVTTKYGKLTGLTSNYTKEFLGVPFATPPVGDLRYQRPQPVQAWGSREAILYAPACYQHNDTFTVLNKVSEDCLYLNVYAPLNPPSDKLPVMIFFYGGSWAEGAASFFLYDGQFVTKYVKDVIVVTVNYRLASFGFLGSSLLKAEDPEGSTGNMGLLDQRMAMQFMKDTAASFGGDPDNIMIYGESAGAGSVSAHLVMPNSWPLFQHAGMESGPIADWTAKPLDTAQSQFDHVAKALNCDTAADVLACMRAVDSETAYKAAKGIQQALLGLLSWNPVVDGVEIVDDPRKLAAEGKTAPVPVLLGTNADEGSIFIRFASHELNQTGFEGYLIDLFGTDLAQKVIAKYPPSNYVKEHPENTIWWTLSHVFGDSQMTCAARRTARWHSASGNKVYLYFYTHILEVIQLFVKFVGCCHGSELPMVFHQDEVLIGSGEKPLADHFVEYWTVFAANGDPNSANNAVSWPAYTQADDSNIRMDIPVSTESGLKKDLCDFWDANRLTLEQVWGTSSKEE